MVTEHACHCCICTSVPYWWRTVISDCLIVAAVFLLPQLGIPALLWDVLLVTWEKDCNSDFHMSSGPPQSLLQEFWNAPTRTPSLVIPYMQDGGRFFLLVPACWRHENVSVYWGNHSCVCVSPHWSLKSCEKEKLHFHSWFFVKSFFVLYYSILIWSLSDYTLWDVTNYVAFLLLKSCKSHFLGNLYWCFFKQNFVILMWCISINNQ